MIAPRIVAWRNSVGLALGLLVTLSTVASVAEQNYWNRYRGPDGTGTMQGCKPPVEFSETKNVRWKTPIHGKGWSSPVVWDQQVWLTTATEDGKELSALCIDLETGEVVHDLLVFEIEQPAFCHPANSYASCTPYAESDRVFVHYGSSGTACIDNETGEVLWQRQDLPCDHFRGPASSPVVEGNNLLIHFDGIDQQYVIALDKYSGKTIWRKDRDIDYGTDVGDFKKAYGTPTLIDLNGQRQMVSPAAVETIVYDPADGDELWRVRHGGMNASTAPIHEYGLVYINAGTGDNSLIAVRPPKSESESPQIVWSTRKAVPQRGSVIVTNGGLFMFGDNGVATCLAARSGQKFWSQRLSGQFWSSPILADGRLYCGNKEGEVFVIKAAPEFKVLAKNTFPNGFYATPALVENSLILRSTTHLYRIGK